MPLVPRYALSQTPTHVALELSIPHVRVSTSTLELVVVDGTDLHLHAPPTYLLKLTFPGRVVGEDAVEESLAAAAAAGSDVVRVVGEDGGAGDDGNGANTEPTAAAAHATIWTKDDLPKLQYDPEKNHGTLVVTLRKEEEGIWTDLDLLGRLQQPSRRKEENGTPRTNGAANKPLIQVVDADGDANASESKLPESEVLDDLLSLKQKRPTYGLFGHFSNVFRDYAREGLVHEMLECPNPDEVYEGADESDNRAEKQNRREMRLEMEDDKFDPDRYLNDLNIEEEGDMIFDAAMAMVPHWMQTSADGTVETITEGLSKLSTSGNENTFFSSEESHLLATLPPQRIDTAQLTPEQRRSAFLSLVDVLYAYAYDHRTTDGDPTVESSWTAMILSPSLAWLESYDPPYDTVADVLRWNVRRSLIYPYLRSFALARKIVEDVCQIVKRGRRTIIRCLLQLHRIMEKSECHYLFNKMHVDPLICWVQQCEEQEVQEFGRELADLLDADKQPDPLGKEYLGLGLVELEKTCGESESSSSEEEDDDSEEESDSDSK
ncbi:hypothetical protein ACHAXT_006819 [Thalassiosira profunda]